MYADLDSSDLPTCPIWTYPSPPHNECVRGSSLEDAIICNSETLTVQLTVRFFCLTITLLNSKGVTTPLLGTCPYGNVGILPKNVTHISEDPSLCSHFNRKGQLCGECAENYTLTAYSYYLGCVKCENYNNGWIKCVTAAFFPLTFFYIVMIIFRISATSSTLNAFVMVNQVHL